MNYKYNEDTIINEIKEYVDSTYGEHYSDSQIQAMEYIVSTGNGRGFCVGNIFKYLHRYGKKEGENIKDLYKVIHYALLLIHNEKLLLEENE